MATRTTLKSYFETGDKPTQSEFAELIDGVPNLTDSSVSDAEFAQLDGVTSPIQTQIDGKQAAIAAGTTAQYYRGDKTFVALDKTAVGLPNVDNTSDANKPVSTATQTALDLKADLTGATFTGAVTAPDFIGDLNGAVRFTAKNESGATLLKGKVVAIIGVSGTETTVDLADADNASARPAFGLVWADANNNAAVEIVTFGNLDGLDTSAFSEGDTLYVDTTAGGLTTTPPTSEAADIQNIGRVIRSHASAGIIKVIGAGRANATPNLDSAKIFLGNASNQSVATAVTGEVTISNTGVTEVTGIDGNISIQGFRPYLRETGTARTLSLTDAGTFISAENVGGTEITIPTNAVAFTAGTEIDFIQKTAGTLTLAAAAGVTLNGAVAGSVAVTAIWGGVTIKLIATNEWIAVGKI
tara:strand:- start:436 stop:1674 length:1239 start_codon:yes stop_codon:yes gene_type:complete